MQEGEGDFDKLSYFFVKLSNDLYKLSNPIRRGL